MTVRFPEPHEVDGFWAQDRIHAPRPISPLAVDMITDTMAIGFTRAHAEYGAPLDMFTRPVNHYLFSSMRPPADPDELARRAERYVELPRRLDEVGPTWETEWKPQLIESVMAGRAAEYRSMTNDELSLELERQRNHMIDQWTIHGKINFGVVAGARFVDFYNEVFEPADATEAYQLLQGFVTQTVRASQRLWSLSRRVLASPELRRLFGVAAAPGASAGPASAGSASSGSASARFDRAAVLRALEDPLSSEAIAAFAADFGSFLDEFGWRSDAVYDVADITWREDPSIPLDALAGYLTLTDEHDPSLAFERAAHRREELLAAARAKLAEDPERLALFEHYYEAGRHNLPLTEDHAFWIDQSGVVNVRRFLLQVGERLVEDGCIDRAEDIFFLDRHEVIDALHDRIDQRTSVTRRATSLAEAAAVEAPRTLGTPLPPTEGPLDPLVDALVIRLAGRRPPSVQDDEASILTGLAASPGVVTGLARVVKSLAEAAKLEDGDILVCEMTLPPWVPLFAVAGAVVADTGGVMSHCAIVAREFGLPAVVGTQFGTRTISDGMRVTVDGHRGEVRIDRQAGHATAEDVNSVPWSH